MGLLSTILHRPVLLAILVLILVIIVAVVILLKCRSQCPYRLPRWLRPYPHNMCDYSNLDSWMQQVVEHNARSESVDEDDDALVEVIYHRTAPSESSCDFPLIHDVQQCVAASSPFIPAPPFSDSSRCSSSDDLDSSLPDLDTCRRGTKRKRVFYNSDSDVDEYDDGWVLDERHFRLPSLPTTEAEVVKRLEKGFTGRIRKDAKPEFFIYNW